MKYLHFLDNGCTVVAFPYKALDLEASKEIALAVIAYWAPAQALFIPYKAPENEPGENSPDVPFMAGKPATTLILVLYEVFTFPWEWVALTTCRLISRTPNVSCAWVCSKVVGSITRVPKRRYLSRVCKALFSFTVFRCTSWTRHEVKVKVVWKYCISWVYTN